MYRIAKKAALLQVGILTVMLITFSTLTTMAQDARIKISIVKVGLIVGVGGGSGTLYYKRKAYPLSVGGVSLGATIGGSVAELSGTVRNLKRPSDIAGQYSGVGGGGAFVIGATAVQLQNQKGVIINLSGPQAGLEFTLDLGGMTISFE